MCSHSESRAKLLGDRKPNANNTTLGPAPGPCSSVCSSGTRAKDGGMTRPAPIRRVPGLARSSPAAAILDQAQQGHPDDEPQGERLEGQGQLERRVPEHVASHRDTRIGPVAGVDADGVLIGSPSRHVRRFGPSRRAYGTLGRVTVSSPGAQGRGPAS